MTSLDKAVIDRLCESYEEFRSPTNSGPKYIESFLSYLPHGLDRDQANDPSLLSELIQIDMQLNWMRWERNLRTLVDQSDASIVRKQMAAIPRLPDYTCLINQESSSDSIEAITATAQCEMEARDRWGDAVGPVFYKAKYGLEVSSKWPHENVVMTCRKKGAGLQSEFPTFTIRGTTNIGRRRSQDAEEFSQNELAEGNRIDIAHRFQDLISREQLTVELLSPKYTIVTNRSALNPVLVANGADLAPGQTTILALNYILKLPHLRLHFLSPSLSSSAGIER